MKKKILLGIPFLAAIALAGQASLAADSDVVRYSKAAKFEEVRQDLVIAIQNKGLVIDHTSHIHKMLERTKKDLGAKMTVYKEGQAFSFCSARLSRATMEADPHNMAFCPYAIVVYTTDADPKTVHVAYRRPFRPDGTAASKASLKNVEDLLDGIARDALGMKKK
jgi:uncharacterized protein (DUF302 family)